MIVPILLSVCAASGPVSWPMERLVQPPRTFETPAEMKTNGVETVFLEGEPYHGQPTRIFAYYGVPKRTDGEKVPAMVLVHGGNGSAFYRWVKLWNDRGYAAISIDTCGSVSGNVYGDESRGHRRHEWAGPEGWGGYLQTDEAITDQWTYHAVAAVIRANSFLRAQPGVDPGRIGLTGVSWGGYLTCIAASVDHRFAFAAPVYGTGFVTDPDAAWMENPKTLTSRLDPAVREKWTALWDPRHYLSGIAKPVLWLDGTNDGNFSIPSLVRSQALVTAPQTAMLRINWPHSHGAVSEAPPELFAFADSLLKGAPRLPRITACMTDAGVVTLAYEADAALRPVRATLNWTLDSGVWAKRTWKSAAARMTDRTVTATVPAGASAWYVNLECADGKVVSSRVGIDPRPYEFRLVDRRVDPVPALVDFEDGPAWTVTCENAVARFEVNGHYPLFGQRSAELVYRATGDKPSVRLRPAHPLPVVPEDFDTFSVWIRGCRWTHGANSQAVYAEPIVEACFVLSDGSRKSLGLQPLRWMDWNWVLRSLTADERRTLKGAAFDGFRLFDFSERGLSTVHFDNVAFWADPRKPLRFRLSPRRNLTPLAGTDLGLNTGAGTLPFPTREETILPPPPKGTKVAFRYAAEKSGPAFYVACPDGSAANVLADGGVLEILDGKGTNAVPVSATELSRAAEGADTVVRWRYLAADGAAAVVKWTFRTWGNSLVIDLQAESGTVLKVSPGDVGGVKVTQAFTVPYLANGPDTAKGRDPLRSPVTVFGNGAKPLFRLSNIDWYRSNASSLGGDKASSGRSRQTVSYVAKTDGTRVPLVERFFVTVSDEFADVLPSVPNPKSSFMREMGSRLWRSHGSSDRARDAAFWRKLHRYGIRQVIVNDHETMWRDGGESYTFRTTFAPGKGGDAGQHAFTRLMIDELGYLYGPYNNFWDHSPVNADFDPDDILRLPSGAFCDSWMRTYTPKPARMPEWNEKYVTAVQRKMHFNTAYCDCHAAGTPWGGHTDYDARVPGAGTFAATFYATGEMLLAQKRGWEGPVFSEGAARLPFAGLIDGNYADDRGYDFLSQPWLVDFDLRELHARECDFGMGTLSMFRRSPEPMEQRHYLPHCTSDADRTDLVDHFLCATVAFGHTGLLLADFCFDPPRVFGEAYGDSSRYGYDWEKGFPIAWRSYFMIQAAAARYTQAGADEIAYADGKGALQPTTAAILSGAVARRQVAVRYADGTRVAANGNDTERMKVSFGGTDVDLPPHGYRIWTEDGLVLSESSDRGGARADYAESPDYIYLDGRGKPVARAKARGTGPAVCRREGNGWEIIFLGEGDCEFRIPGGKAMVLDESGKELGSVESFLVGGWYRVKRLKEAVSYLIRPQ